MHGILLTAGLFVVLVTMASSNRLVCYYDRNAAARSSLGQFTPANIDPNLCTHIIFSYAAIDNKNLVPVVASDTTLYDELNNLKATNPQLKTLLAVGGPGFDDHEFHPMAASENNRANFITSAIAELQNHGFDGLDLDWRYPAGKKQRTGFTSLCQELRASFSSLTPPLLLTASVSGVKTVIDDGYEVNLIAPELDFINVLTFNFYDTTATTTAHHSPLASNPGDTLTTQFAMNYWTTLGAPAAKLNMGIAAFGVALQLTDPNVNGVGAPASGTPEAGCYESTPGVWSYYEVCLYRQGGNMVWIQDQSVPYTVTEGQWAGYDNYDSLDAKVAHINTNGYGGACVWALDLDDYSGQFCQEGQSPFINYLKSILNP